MPTYSFPKGCSTELSEKLTELTNAVLEVTPDSSLVLYGSIARGERRADGDINLAIVAKELPTKSLLSLHTPLQRARRRDRVHPWLLVTSEVTQLADVFPLKLRDIQTHHHLIVGDDPFTNIEIDKAHLRLRLEQELRNHLSRLRAHLVRVGDASIELSRALYRSSRSLRVELEVLMHLLGQDAPSSSRRDIFEMAGPLFDSPTLLSDLLDLHNGQALEAPARTYGQLLELLERLVSKVDSLESRA